MRNGNWDFPASGVTDRRPEYVGPAEPVYLGDLADPAKPWRDGQGNPVMSLVFTITRCAVKDGGHSVWEYGPVLGFETEEEANVFCADPRNATTCSSCGRAGIAPTRA